jgi:hypothetical protein
MRTKLPAWLLVLMLSGSASADVILDQSHDLTTSGFSTSGKWAQTFTVGVSGTLARVEARLFSQADPILFEIRTTTPSPSGDELIPSMTDLASGVTPGPISAFTWVAVDVTPFAVGVHEGEVLALVLSQAPSPTFGWVWTGDAEGRYGRGSGFLGIGPTGETWIPFQGTGGGGIDFNFRTYVDLSGPGQVVPEPSALLLFSFAALILLASALRDYRTKRRLKMESPH